MSDRVKILESLEPMFKEAKEKKLWFYCDYQGLWFSPKELAEKQEDGLFIWGSPNWELRDPQECLGNLRAEIRGIRGQIADLERRIALDK